MHTRLALTLTILLATACKIDRPETDGVDPNYDGPGSEAWGSDDVSCDLTSDCLSNESCIDNVCQVQRCTAGPYDSLPPVGERVQLFTDAELGVVDAASWSGKYVVDGYSPNGSTLSYDNSWERGNTTPLDIAGGRFTSDHAEYYAIIEQSQGAIGLLTGDTPNWTVLEFYPTFLGAGDIDSDGTEEAFAASDDGRIAVCRLDKGQCDYASFEEDGVEILDIAGGDIDGDTYDEIAILMEIDGARLIYIHNNDAEFSHQYDYYAAAVSDDTKSLAVADLDGDNVAEIIALEDGGWFSWLGYGEDKAVVYNAYEASPDMNSNEPYGSLEVAQTFTVSGHTGLIDIAAGDTDADRDAEVALLDENGEIVMLSNSGGSLHKRFTQAASSTNQPVLIAFADHDGNSPLTSLVEGPIQCDGNVVPLMVLIPPPYDKDYSSQAGTAAYGSTDYTSENFTDTVSLGMDIDVGVGASFFDIFAAKVSETLSWKVDHYTSVRTSLGYGGRYSMTGQPEVYGPHHGAVTLAWGCFNAYVYEVEDPSGILGPGADGEQFVMTVPVDGAVSLWSTTRYNAMAEAVGNLPIIDLTYTVGDPSSYPTEVVSWDGRTLDDEELLFNADQWYTVSDVGAISWRRSVSERETEGWRMNQDMGLSASVTAAGITVGGGVSVGWGTGYSLQVGTGAFFSGSLPALPDDPDTPEDEWSQHRYSMNPYVYLHTYETENGGEAYYYVQHFIVEQ